LVPLPKFVTGRLPETPVESGKPVALVSTAETGVPNEVMFPASFNCGDLDATSVIKTFLVPAENKTADPAFEEV
jgi:hypothetical protein